jgi:hypothetical protein
MRVALLTVTAPGGEPSAASRLCEALHAALKTRGVQAERIDLPGGGRDFDSTLRAHLRFYDADLSAFDGVISTAAPSYAVRHRNLVCYVMQTMDEFYDLFETTLAQPSAAQRAQRDIIHQIDTAALARASLRGVFAAGLELRERLRTFNGIDAELLPAPAAHETVSPWDKVCDTLLGRLRRAA